MTGSELMIILFGLLGAGIAVREIWDYFNDDDDKKN